MISETWPTSSYSILRLQLDPENPRLGTSLKRPTQQQLLADLLQHEEVIELAKQISRQGYFPNETLVAIKEGARILVVEGNRRLAALKLLLNPDLAPDAYQKRLRTYAAEWKNPIKSVPIVIAPTRAETLGILVARHNGKPVKYWTPVMQSRFISLQRERGLDIDKIAAETGMDRGEVVKELRNSKLYDVILSLPLAANIAAIVQDPRSFPFTTLERLVDFSAIQKVLGMSTNEEFGFTSQLEPERFQTVLSRIVTDIVKEKVTSRSHNTAEDVRGYIATLEKELGPAPVPKPKSVTTADELVDPAGSSKPSIQQKRASSKAKAKALPKGLIPTTFRVEIEDDRIEAIVTELKRLPIIHFPNATSVLFRSLLDMAVLKFLTDSGEFEAMKKTSKIFKDKRPDWAPSLGQLLSHLLNTSTIPLPPDGRKSLQKFLTDANHSLTLDSLNWFTHNRYVPPTVDQLRAFWTMLTPLLKLTLQTPE